MEGPSFALVEFSDSYKIVPIFVFLIRRQISETQM